MFTQSSDYTHAAVISPSDIVCHYVVGTERAAMKNAGTQGTFYDSWTTRQYPPLALRPHLTFFLP